MLRTRRPGVGWMQNVSLDIILPAAYPRGYGAAAHPDNEWFLFCPHPSKALMTYRRLYPGSHPSAIPSTMPSAAAAAVSVVSRVSISGSFRLVVEVREPMESFLISDENATATPLQYESSQSARAAPYTLDRLYFRSVLSERRSFSSVRDLRWFTIRMFPDGNGVIWLASSRQYFREFT